jgi:FixJ family two-component response regulator
MLDHYAEQLKLKELEAEAAKAAVAIVDDDYSFSIMLKEYLYSNCEIKADLFDSGDAFLKEYHAKDTRKIILDYDFGTGPDGLTVLQRIKAINPSATVIMVSAQDDLEIAIETLRKGAIDYFLKTSKTVFANILSSLMKILELERNKWN